MSQKLVEKKNAVSREDMVNYALQLGVTNPKEMFNPELKDAIKQALYHNCLVLAAMIRKEKNDKKPKENALWVVSTFLKENPRGDTKEQRQFISNLIFKLWVERPKKVVVKQSLYSIPYYMQYSLLLYVVGDMIEGLFLKKKKHVFKDNGRVSSQIRRFYFFDRKRENTPPQKVIN